MLTHFLAAKQHRYRVYVHHDSHISMAAQVNSVISSSYYQIHQLGTIRKYISGSTCLKVVLALVTSCLDYCNVFLNVIPGYQMDILRRVQNNAARLIARCRKDCHITSSPDPPLAANLPEYQVQVFDLRVQDPPRLGQA